MGIAHVAKTQLSLFVFIRDTSEANFFCINPRGGAEEMWFSEGHLFD